MKRHKKSGDAFSGMNQYATGLVGFGISTAVGAGIASKAPPGTPSLTQGFNTAASFTPIMGTAVGGKSVLKIVKKGGKHGIL